MATLKYYLREGLLHAGRATSRTQAEYDDSHVERVRLVRALTDIGGLSLADVGRVLAAISADDVERIGVLAAAQRSLHGADPSAPTDCGPSASPTRSRVHDWINRRGWQVDPTDPIIANLENAWRACDDVGLGLDEERMHGYADAMEVVATIDVDSVPMEPQKALRQVVLGTVLVDPVLAALRRLAQQHVALSRLLGGPQPEMPVGGAAEAGADGAGSATDVDPASGGAGTDGGSAAEAARLPARPGLTAVGRACAGGGVPTGPGVAGGRVDPVARPGLLVDASA